MDRPRVFPASRRPVPPHAGLSTRLRRTGGALVPSVRHRR
jgi:hypothetical protein